MEQAHTFDSRSRPQIACDSEGCEMNSTAAAPVMPPWSTTARKYSSERISSRPPQIARLVRAAEVVQQPGC
jgi:hypothetical protein